MNVRMIPAIGLITFSESVRIMANTPGEKFAVSGLKIFLESGYDIELIPPVKIKIVHTPGFTMQGKAWEMKLPKAIFPFLS